MGVASTLFNLRIRIAREDDKSCHTIPTLGPACTGAVSVRPLLSLLSCGHSAFREAIVGEAMWSTSHAITAGAFAP